MTWVLILALTGHYRAAITTHEFNSHEACKNAGEMVVQQSKTDNWAADPSFVCAPKDVLSPVR